MKNKGVLYLIPSSISEETGKQNLTPQLAEILPGIQYFIAEHAREARRFISSLKLGIKIDELQFRELNKHSDHEEVISMLDPALNGNNMGLMSDAGCPGVADSGAEVVKLAHHYNIKVVPLVGPSSILLALMASGLSGQNYNSERGKSFEVKNKMDQQDFLKNPRFK
jgi:16S rRNA (cytidine1402-2'-O)-methyltransferase